MDEVERLIDEYLEAMELDEYIPMSTRQHNKMIKTMNRAHSSDQKKKNREKRLAYKRNTGGLRTKKERYVKKTQHLQKKAWGA
jgi:hypothetical protein